MTAFPPRAACAITFTLTLTLLTGCGTYEPPKPGRHAGPGEPPADIICAYETPTASTFVRLRCDRAADLKARGEEQRREIDETRRSGPLIN